MKVVLVVPVVPVAPVVPVVPVVGARIILIFRGLQGKKLQFILTLP